MNLTTTENIINAHENINQMRVEKARENLLAFARYNINNFQSTWFHKTFYNILTNFANGKIKKLMLSVPPQHGKSTGSSISLPAFMIGHVCIATSA